MLREYILSRGPGEYSFDDLKKFARCRKGLELDDRAIVDLLRRFYRPGVRLSIDLSRRSFAIEIDYPDELLRYVLENSRGRTLREALEEFRKFFGDYEEQRLLRIFRILRDIKVEKEGRTIPLSRILKLDERLDAKIVRVLRILTREKNMKCPFLKP